MHYVYVLRCADDKLYTGCTNNLKDRIYRHQKGKIPATKEELPVELISYFAFQNKYTAHIQFRKISQIRIRESVS